MGQIDFLNGIRRSSRALGEGRVVPRSYAHRTGQPEAFGNHCRCMGLLVAAIACRPNCAHCRDTVKGFSGFRSALKDEADIDRQAKPAGSVENDLGCVKTCPREQRAELFSLLSFLDSAHQHCYFFILQKSRQTFYAQIQFWSFHTAKTLCGLCRSVLLNGTTANLMRLIRICWSICILVRP